MRFVTVACSLALSSLAIANPSEKTYTQTEYVNLWSSVAVSQMQTFKIPASITLAQGILESGNGNSELARKANNHFGIKCHEWKGETIILDDDKADECFRKYGTADESYKDHSLFLTGRTRYAKLFALPMNDYKAWAQGLKDAGYATNPKYPAQLIELIQRLSLDKYDEQVIPKNNEGSEMLAEEVKNSKKETAAKAYQAHAVKVHKNKIDYIVARKGDTYYKISKEFKIGMWQLYRYNDFGPKKDLLEEGDIVYLEPKRRRAKEKGATYVAAKNTTITAISQSEGIKVESLMEMNNISSPDEIVPKGQKILLR
jgi:LysM repeat protein